jgi:predicted HTH domain antitoxin
MISLLAGVSIEMRKEEIKVRKVPVKSYKLNL